MPLRAQETRAYFNSHPRVRGDAIAASNAPNATNFNSHPRVRGDLIACFPQHDLPNFNSHPRVRGDALEAGHVLPPLISIRTPA